jgi:hypothetical protein
MATPEKTNVFQFMSVRAPQTVDDKKLTHFYIKDEYINGTEEEDGQITSVRKLRELFSKNSSSQVGKLLFEKIFCDSTENDISAKNEAIVHSVLDLVEFKTISCEEYSDSTQALPETLINDLEQVPYIFFDNKYYLLPARLDSIVSEFGTYKLILAKKIIQKHTKKFDRERLFKELCLLFDVNALSEIVYDNFTFHSNYQQIRSVLFEKLYILYVLRRITAINLEEIISGLQTLHTLEILAADDVLYKIKKGDIISGSGEANDLIHFLSNIFPGLRETDISPDAQGSFFVGDENDLLAYFESTPVIHPIVAQLSWYKQPFNKLKPIGIGDLKVVKQWLCGYKVGEISHIHNIMKGELKERNHRHLEKTEEAFSFSSENSSNTQTENQTTDKFETKREVEKVLKTDINVGANANFTYNSGGVFTANVGGNFAYSNSSQDTQKTAANHARDVMSKAVSQIQTRSTQNRSITKLFETEETNKHSFENKQPNATHISGIYRWLDKKYKAQLYNYGKRLMFEFIIPEPAAFYVKSKLTAAEFDINAPQKPPLPTYETVVLKTPNDPLNTVLFPETITKQVFNELSQIYDLAEFTYPITSFWLPFTDKQGGDNNLSRSLGNSGDRIWTNSQFRSDIPEGYDIEQLKMQGTVVFYGSAENTSEEFEMNRYRCCLNGETVAEILDNSLEDRKPNFKKIEIDKTFSPASIISNKEVILDLNIQDLEKFSLSAYLRLRIKDDYLLSWRTKVYNKIKSIEQNRIDKINQERKIRYDAKLADYDNALNELNAQVVNDIIQGRSEAFNRQTILEELKKHCITMITKEFDADNSDDILSGEDALEDVNVNIEYDKFVAGEVPVPQTGSTLNPNSQTRTVLGFEELTKNVDYPKINIDIAKKEARYIQFLEQAFEWQHLAYIFYPYFWAAEKNWIKLMNRLDYTDNNMTAFLKAGSARVLIAVTPAYNDAVMHFLATREPWEGGPLPVIGDPLFIPIYEEIRKQQDDLQNAKPDGTEWEFELPTSLVYLQDSSSPVPEDLQCPAN